MYRKQKIPKFMDFFHMLSDSLSPESIGLRNKQKIKNYIRFK
jgi:hypothetical protein